jgi:V/A-type H+-transporting ATPase subunit D
MIRKLKLPPTKTTLIRLKRQVAFLHQGQDLLERKGELLGRLIHQHLQEYRQLREVMHKKVHDAYHWLGIMQMRMDSNTLDCATEEVHRAVEINILPRIHLGVEYPSVTTVKHDLNPIGLLGTDASFDETRAAMRDMAIMLSELGQSEITLSRLIDEHRKIQKRVNALKYNIIPSHEATIKFIHDSMEESERESVFQLKMLRGKIEERKYVDGS